MNDRAKFLEANDDQKDRINKIRNLFSELYNEIEKKCKPSRETSLVSLKTSGFEAHRCAKPSKRKRA